MDISELTLYGRMAYGIRCCYVLGEKKKANMSGLSFILHRLCDFTTSDNLSEWEEMTLPLMPECIFEAVDEYGGSECRDTRCHAFHLNSLNLFCESAKTCRLVVLTKRSGEEQQAYQVFLKTDDELLYVIQALYGIGASELYGEPTDCKESEIFLKDIMAILEKNDVEIPPLTEFSHQTLNDPQRDMDYYGEKFDCTYIVKEFTM